MSNRTDTLDIDHDADTDVQTTQLADGLPIYSATLCITHNDIQYKAKISGPDLVKINVTVKSNFEWLLDRSELKFEETGNPIE